MSMAGLLYIKLLLMATLTVSRLYSYTNHHYFCPLSILVFMLLSQLLIARGALLDDFTPTGYCPIHLAAMNGHVHCLQVELSTATNCTSSIPNLQHSHAA